MNFKSATCRKNYYECICKLFLFMDEISGKRKCKYCIEGWFLRGGGHGPLLVFSFCNHKNTHEYV